MQTHKSSPRKVCHPVTATGLYAMEPESHNDLCDGGGNWRWESQGDIQNPAMPTCLDSRLSCLHLQLYSEDFFVDEGYFCLPLCWVLAVPPFARLGIP